MIGILTENRGGIKRLANVKTVQKKHVKNTESSTQVGESVEHGIRLSKNLKTNSNVKIVSVGKCAKCGKEFVRPHPCTHAVCQCENPAVLVPLEPAIMLSRNNHTKLKFLAELAGVSEDYVLDVLLHHSMMEVYDKGLLKLATNNVVICYKKKCGKRMKQLTDPGWSCRDIECKQFKELKLKN